MAYTVVIAESAAKMISKLEASARNRVANKIDGLANDPRPSGVVKLEGSELYRVRVGDYRIIYSIHDKELVVVIARVAHRKEAYR
jgi:mRNA interferase RelE/StbE